MNGGYAGEFYLYHLDDGLTLLVEPDENIAPNLEHFKRNDKIILFKKYNENYYPYYDNYDAINVNKIKDIPLDFEGIMGVPITFLDKHNPKQFDILGIMNSGEENKGIRYENTPHGRPIIKGVEKYLRILIKRIK